MFSETKYFNLYIFFNLKSHTSLFHPTYPSILLYIKCAGSFSLVVRFPESGCAGHKRARLEVHRLLVAAMEDVHHY